MYNCAEYYKLLFLRLHHVNKVFVLGCIALKIDSSSLFMLLSEPHADNLSPTATFSLHEIRRAFLLNVLSKVIVEIIFIYLHLYIMNCMGKDALCLVLYMYICILYMYMQTLFNQKSGGTANFVIQT